MDKSILPGMTRRSFPWFTSKPKKRAAAKPTTTKAGSVDDDARARIERRKKMLKEAAGD